MTSVAMISLLSSTSVALEGYASSATGGTVTSLSDLVSEEDSAHAARKTRKADVQRALASRAALRMTLARHCDRGLDEARHLRIDRPCSTCGAQHGQPRTKLASLSSSHSADSVLAAAGSRDLRLGVDIEALPTELFAHFDDYVLHPEERLELARQISTQPPSTREPPALRHEAAAYPVGSHHPSPHLRQRLLHWSLKEATLKAAGIGLQHPPCHLLLGEPARYTQWSDGFHRRALLWRPVVQTLSSEAAGLWTCAIPAAPGYVAAVSASHPQDVHARQLD